MNSKLKLDRKGTKENDARNEKREQLFLTSDMARELREKMIAQAETADEVFILAHQPLNYFIRSIYGLQKSELRTFREWKKDGYTIKKGEHAHLFWGQPLKVKPKTEEIPDMEKKDEPQNDCDFYPLCFLFDENQAYRRDPEEHPEAEPETVEAEAFECVEL